MKFSLVQVTKKTNGLVDAVWLQDYTGELEMAIKRARETEEVNGNRIEVAVVEKTNCSCPNYSLLTKLKRLD